jgi:hypothetical protein
MGSMVAGETHQCQFVGDDIRDLGSGVAGVELQWERDILSQSHRAKQAAGLISDTPALTHGTLLAVARLKKTVAAV